MFRCISRHQGNKTSICNRGNTCCMHADMLNNTQPVNLSGAWSVIKTLGFCAAPEISILPHVRFCFYLLLPPVFSKKLALWVPCCQQFPMTPQSGCKHFLKPNISHWQLNVMQYFNLNELFLLVFNTEYRWGQLVNNRRASLELLLTCMWIWM